MKCFNQPKQNCLKYFWLSHWVKSSTITANAKYIHKKAAGYAPPASSPLASYQIHAEKPNYDTARMRMQKTLTSSSQEGRETKQRITWVMFFKATGKQNWREKQNYEAQEGREREIPSLQLATQTKWQVPKSESTDIRRQVFLYTKENTWKTTYKEGLI